MIDNIIFTWDESKAQTNFMKHKVSFDEAKTVFEDENARLLLDPDHSEEEERFILLGLSIKSKILTVVHCYRDDEENIRIISARKSTKVEQTQYKEFLL
ncbi:MAG TPA: BrnT family toxin [Sulfurospirillum arcachonense]|nr:BrnT family toxin [Sulfurospirillum arcachonense]